MKKFILFILLLGCSITTYYFKDDITLYIEDYLHSKIITIDNKNKYYRDYDFDFVQNTSYFKPENKQDILNIYYTTINSGLNTFTFYCPKEYKKCIEEVKMIADNQDLLSHINNYVHPYNSFSHIETIYDNTGKVTINLEKLYTDDLIMEIDNKIDTLMNELVNNNNSDIDNIKNIHDYIINNSKYDSLRSDKQIINYKSDIAYGPLIEGYGLCGGYTDLMELFLERLNIKSYKISSQNHVWNAVYLDNKWQHLDLTWDDPVASDETDILEHTYFMIDTKPLLDLNDNEHIFDQSIYSELKIK